MEEQALGANVQVATSTACFRPSNNTYAAMVECECLGDLVNICGESLVEDTVGCLFDHACRHPKVCNNWKKSNCPYSALQLQYASDIQEQTLLHHLFPTSKDAGLKLPQFEYTVSHLGLTPEQVKSLWSSLEKDWLGNHSHNIPDFTGTRHSLISSRNHKHKADLNDHMISASLDKTVAGKCTAD
jgi:hypothetical protein